MKTPLSLISTLALLVLCSCAISTKDKKNSTVTVTSPNNRYELVFNPGVEGGEATYEVRKDGTQIIAPSGIGFRTDKLSRVGRQVEIVRQKKSSERGSWKPPYGERNRYPENYNQTRVDLLDVKHGLQFSLLLRAYDEGVALCYAIPGQDTLDRIRIISESTEFKLSPRDSVWQTERSQGPYAKQQVQKLSGMCERPLLVEREDHTYTAIGEAAGVNYSRMLLKRKDGSSDCLVSHLQGASTLTLPAQTPWRWIMAAETAGELLEQNYLVLNLNEPNRLGKADWIKPGKVIRDMALTTQGGKACVDFAVKHNLQYVIESAGWYGNEFTTEADASTVTLDPKRSKGPLDLQEVIRYGNERGIGILVYVNRNQLEKQLDQILPLYEQWGLKGIKYGFVRTGSQQWTDWMHEAVRKAADHKMVLSIHDDYRPIGYSRTYPNLMTVEGIRGDEETPKSEQTLVTMFTRMLAGAGDNTICYFAPRVDTMGSHASQLAKAVCLYSPLQWLYWYDRPRASLRESDEANRSILVIRELPDLEFFDAVPTVWDDTRVIHSEVGQLGTIARRHGNEWFVGTLNGNEARSIQIPLDFLKVGTTYAAKLFYDDPGIKTETRVGIQTIPVTRDSVIKRDLRAGNGMAIWIRPTR